jgi:hypothetical protein
MEYPAMILRIACAALGSVLLANSSAKVAHDWPTAQPAELLIQFGVLLPTLALGVVYLFEAAAPDRILRLLDKPAVLALHIAAALVLLTALTCTLFSSRTADAGAVLRDMKGELTFTLLLLVLSCFKAWSLNKDINKPSKKVRPAKVTKPKPPTTTRIKAAAPVAPDRQPTGSPPRKNTKRATPTKLRRPAPIK